MSFLSIVIAITLLKTSNIMAIDTKSLSQLITEFRKFTAKDSVSPESLGYILQCIADLLLPAGTSETVAELKKILDGFKKFGEVVTSNSQ